MATVFGNDWSETINALDGVTNGADTIFGFGGNDSIFGLGGNDLIKGGGGADAINGGSGIDTAEYSDSTEAVVVSLATGQGFGGTAEGDTLTSVENLTGSAYNDWLTGDDGANVLTGMNGDDVLKGGGGADTLNGDSGNDTLKGGGGADTLNGGAGIDTASYTESGAGVFISLITDTAAYGDAEGDDLNSIENVTGSAFHDDLWGNDGANVLNGMGGNDTLKGYGGADTLLGGDGNDTLYGMDGDDILRGEAGNDTMIGGNGNDTYYVDSANDVITETGAATVDTVYTSTSFVLTAGANVEVLRTTSDSGTSNINLTGNESSQDIIGNNGNNEITGGLGNDELTGNGGNDTFIFNSALDGTYNVDEITDFNQANDFIALDDAIFGAIQTDAGHYLTGNEFYVGAAAHDADDRIIYNAATGALYYDADGNGAGAAVQFATLDPGMALVNDDFIIV
jgi:Ca2+-binding RTX toxin-like protein